MYFGCMSVSNGKRRFQQCDGANADNQRSLKVSHFGCDRHPCLRENISVVQIKMNHLTLCDIYYFLHWLKHKKIQRRSSLPCGGFTLEIHVVTHWSLQ